MPSDFSDCRVTVELSGSGWDIRSVKTELARGQCLNYGGGPRGLVLVVQLLAYMKLWMNRHPDDPMTSVDATHPLGRMIGRFCQLVQDYNREQCQWVGKALGSPEELLVAHPGKKIRTLRLAPTLPPGNIVVLRGRSALTCADLERLLEEIGLSPPGKRDRLTAGTQDVKSRVLQTLETDGGTSTIAKTLESLDSPLDIISDVLEPMEREGLVELNTLKGQVSITHAGRQWLARGGK